MVIHPIFSPGQTCGGTYSITRLHSRSPVTESYLAQHRRTKQKAILTCSRLDHDDGVRLRPEFLANAAKLQATPVEDAPMILDAGLNDGVYWIARAHFADEVLLWDVLSHFDGAAEGSEKRKAAFSQGPNALCQSLAVAVGARIADILGQFAEKGIIHGGLDPRRTIAIRSEFETIVLETGYGALFGREHFAAPVDELQFQAPEVTLGHNPDQRSDIFSTGALMRCLLLFGAMREGLDPPDYIMRVVLRMTPEHPKARAQSWKELEPLLSECIDQFERAAMTLLGAKSPTGSKLSATTPKSGKRKRTSSDAPDTDPCPAPPLSADNGKCEAPPTTPSHRLPAPTPRVPELPASFREASRPTPVCSVVAAPAIAAAPHRSDALTGTRPAYAGRATRLDRAQSS